MNHFEAREGALWCEEVPLAEIADQVGTPAYVYSAATLRRHYLAFANALTAHPELGEPRIAYAVKANGNRSVLALLAELGAGADTVSEGEIRRALSVGMAPERIVFSGVGKTDAELAFALSARVGQLNVESVPEFERLATLAKTVEGRPAVCLRINPGVGAGGHAKITTGASHNKFGMAVEEAEAIYARAGGGSPVAVVGLACHIGSQIVDLEPLEEAFAFMRDLVLRFRARGFPVQRLDLGGGLGAPYFNTPDPPSPAAFAAMAARVVGDLGVELAFEPGRVIAANAGVLLASVIHVNARPDGHRFVVLDAGMNDLVRPAMYEAWHEIEAVRPRSGEALAYDVVGPVCETADTFARDRTLGPMAAGDLVVLRTAGAYGAVMASQYNGRRLVPEVLVDGDRWRLARPRPTYDEMLDAEPLAPWLERQGPRAAAI